MAEGVLGTEQYGRNDDEEGETATSFYDTVCYTLRTGALRRAGPQCPTYRRALLKPAVVGSERGAPTVPGGCDVCECRPVCMTRDVGKGTGLLIHYRKPWHWRAVTECRQLLFGRHLGRCRDPGSRLLPPLRCTIYVTV